MKDKPYDKEPENIMQKFLDVITRKVIPPCVDCRHAYDSEWEKEFEWVLAKYLPDNFTLTNQYPMCESYRGDFAITCNRTGRVWVIEYDGKTYHDYLRDIKRDGRILQMHDEVQSITRIDAMTGRCHIEDTRNKLSQLLPECFHGVPALPRPAEWEQCDGEYIAEIESENYEDDDENAYYLLRITHRQRK